MEFKISVIVPAYNVEQYIEKCMNSIALQTYSNLEIIAVDDGATDSTPQILDKIAAEDDRIIVIHKNNEGVSAARNTGLDMALGEYVVFVDGDDYLAEDYIEYMVSMAITTGSEFCLSKNCFTRINEKQSEDKVEILSNEDATALLISPRIIVGCWNKIFKRSFLNENKLRFSTKLFYGEGLTFITTAAQIANSIAVGSRKIYYYRRNNEISATTKFSIEKLYNGEKALNYIGDSLIINSKKIADMLLLHKSLFFLGALTRIEANNVKQEYKEDYDRWLKFLRCNYCTIIKSNTSVYRKLMLLGGCISPWVMMQFDKVRRKKIVINSVD